MEEIVLESTRVILRPLSSEDRIHLLPFSLEEPELWTYSLVQGGGQENLDRYFAHALDAKKNGQALPFIVYDKKVDAFAGSTRYYDIHPEHQALSIGYTWYGKDFQGTGLNKHCKFLLLQHAFETLKMQRVEFRADALNQRSIAAMKSIGCTVEGILRSNCSAPKGRRDSIVLSILASEWKDRVKEELLSKL